MILDMLRKRAETGTIQVDVRPNAKKTEILAYISDTGTLKVAVKAPPEQGRANLELVRFLSRILGRDVTIISGRTKKRKILKA